MKRFIFFLPIVAMIYLGTTSCNKTNDVKTVHDTTTVYHKDTLIIKDTVKDTIVVTTPKNPITGLWVGTFQINGASSLGAFYYSFNVFADGTIVQQGGAPNGLIWTGKGTWTLSADSTFTANVANADLSQGSWTQTLTAKYSSVNGALAPGTWVFTSGQSTSGTFSLKRVN